MVVLSRFTIKIRAASAYLAKDILFWYFKKKYSQNTKDFLRDGHTNPRTLFFVPEALVVPYFNLMHQISKKSSIHPTFVKCYDVFRSCPAKVMVAKSRTLSRRDNLKICNDCNRYFQKNISDNNFISLNALISKEISAQIDELIKGTDDLRSLTYEGIPVGEFALYDLFILHKIDDLEKVKLFASDYGRIIYDAIIAIEIFKSLKIRGVNLEAVFFNDHYATVSVARSFLKNSGIKSYSVYKSLFNNLNNSLVKITTQPNFQCSLEGIEAMQKYQNVPLSSNIVKEIAEELISRQKNFGVHRYSPSRNSEKVKHPEGRKIIVAFNSSQDEFLAYAENMKANAIKIPFHDAFSSQYEWLDELICWAEKSDEYFLIIRLHPRIGSTIRDGVRSFEYETYRTRYQQSYRNVKVIWPEEDVSTYNLFDICDVATVAWSTMADELTRVGIPVVTGITKFYFNYDNQNIFKAQTKSDYWRILKELSTKEKSLHSIICAFRNYFFRNIAQYHDLNRGDSFSLLIDSRLDEEGLIKINYDVISSNLEEERAAILEFLNALREFLRDHNQESKLLNSIESLLVT